LTAAPPLPRIPARSQPMPELPEAETIARQLRQHLVGRAISSVTVRTPLIVREGACHLRAVRGQEVRKVRRVGKAVLVELAGGVCLLFRLGMTGQLLLDGSGPLARHCHLVVRLGRGLRVQFVDARRFGGVFVHTQESLPRAPQLCRLGLDPFSAAFTAAWLKTRLSRSRRPLKSLLMDQAVIAGMGNIYASEVLFRAGLHPLTPANAVSSEQAQTLRDETVRVLKAAVARKGTTFADYRDTRGEPGGFAVRLCVYGREGRDCVRCGRPVRRLVIGGRSAFLCPRCQPLRTRRGTKTPR